MDRGLGTRWVLVVWVPPGVGGSGLGTRWVGVKGLGTRWVLEIWVWVPGVTCSCVVCSYSLILAI